MRVVIIVFIVEAQHDELSSGGQGQIQADLAESLTARSTQARDCAQTPKPTCPCPLPLRPPMKDVLYCRNHAVLLRGVRFSQSLRRRSGVGDRSMDPVVKPLSGGAAVSIDVDSAGHQAQYGVCVD